MKDKILYTTTIFSENTVGVLNQITTIFTRRQMNIETLTVSPSAIEGLHKFVITSYAPDAVAMEKVVKQIDKRVDILKAYFNTDDELVHQEVALYKIETEKLMSSDAVETMVRKHNARILEIMPHFTVIEKMGHYDETQALFEELKGMVGVLQFIRSGRVVITRSNVERLSEMLKKRDEERLLIEKN